MDWMFNIDLHYSPTSGERVAQETEGNASSTAWLGGDSYSVRRVASCALDGVAEQSGIVSPKALRRVTFRFTKNLDGVGWPELGKECRWGHWSNRIEIAAPRAEQHPKKTSSDTCLSWRGEDRRTTEPPAGFLLLMDE